MTLTEDRRILILFFNPIHHISLFFSLDSWNKHFQNKALLELVYSYGNMTERCLIQSDKGREAWGCS